MRARPLALVLSSWVCLTAVAAQADEEYGRTGPYLGAAGIYAFENHQDQAPGVRPSNDAGYTVRAGYRALSFLAAEVQFEHLRAIDVDVPIAPGVSGDGELELMTLTGNAKLVYPSGPLQPYALGGIGLMIADGSRALPGNDEDLVTRFGAGVDLYFGDHVVGTLEGTYVMPFDKVNGFDYVAFTWGFQYRF